jgi:hypothetical protein
MSTDSKESVMPDTASAQQTAATGTGMVKATAAILLTIDQSHLLLGRKLSGVID